VEEVSNTKPPLISEGWEGVGTGSNLQGHVEQASKPSSVGHQAQHHKEEEQQRVPEEGHDLVETEDQHHRPEERRNAHGDLDGRMDNMSKRGAGWRARTRYQDRYAPLFPAPAWPQ
jgi:hypothetical protein